MPTSAIRTQVKTVKVIDHKYIYTFEVSKSAIINNELWEQLTHDILHLKPHKHYCDSLKSHNYKHGNKAW